MTNGSGRAGPRGHEPRLDRAASGPLIVLATVIATAGVVAESTATVIGVMIVTPLMTPILGTALSVVLANRRLIVKNLVMVVLGALCIVVIAYVLRPDHPHAAGRRHQQPDRGPGRHPEPGAARTRKVTPFDVTFPGVPCVGQAARCTPQSPGPAMEIGTGTGV